MNLYHKVRHSLGKTFFGKIYRWLRSLPKRVYRRAKYQYLLKRLPQKRKALGGTKGNKVPIIVSLTTIPTRLNGVCLAIDSILCQSLLPDKIILYLDEDVAAEDLPSSLLELKDYGVEICRRQGNIKAHKKYYYAMTEHPDAIIITVDDDQIYPPDLIENLYRDYTACPGCVIAARAHEITFNEKNEVNPYNEWHMEVQTADFLKPSGFLLVTGVGGVLYPPGIIPREVFDIPLIEKLCLNNDDIWLKIGEVQKGVKVKLSDTSLWRRTLEVRGSQTVALCKTNVGEYKNDEQMKRCMEYFHLTADDFKD